jgi:hypothetical protein
MMIRSDRFCSRVTAISLMGAVTSGASERAAGERRRACSSGAGDTGRVHVVSRACVSCLCVSRADYSVSVQGLDVDDEVVRFAASNDLVDIP